MLEWFTRNEALAHAQRGEGVFTAAQRVLFERARGAYLAAGQVSPADDRTTALEAVGDETARTLLALSILRDAAAWALAASQPSPPGSLADAWNAADPARLANAATDPESLCRARRVLLDEEALSRRARPSADLIADLAVTRRFVGALVVELEQRAHGVARARAERWIRSASVVGILVAALFALNAAMDAGRADLVAQAQWTASSNDLGWSASASGRGGARGVANVFFHTRDENNPWVEFDLGRTQGFSHVVIENRGDCCQERAIPLIIETSDDHRRWLEIARRTDGFATWDASFFLLLQARYVRLRVPRRTVFHLQSVDIR